jgi:multiple sugar transport system substrate-binding protein
MRNGIRRGPVALMSAAFVLLCTAQAIQAAEPTKVVFYFRGGDLQAETVNQWKADFEEKNPSITVEWQIPAADWMAKLPVMVAAGMGPDVYESWGVNGRYWGENGVSLDLTPYVKRDFRAVDIQDFYLPVWNATELTWGPRKGVRHGLPSNGNVFLMYYNKSMFAESGVPNIDVLDKQNAWNWDTLVAQGKKLVRMDGDKVTRWALDSDDLYAPTGRGATWLHAAGAQFFDLPYNPTKFVGNSPEAIRALQFMVDQIWEHNLVAPLNIRGQARWVQSHSAILMWQGTASLGSLEKTLTSFDWDLAPKPMGPKNRGYLQSPDMFSINAGSKVKEAAWLFLKYLTSKDGQEIYSKVMGRTPTRRSAFPFFQSLYPNRSTIYATLGMMEGGILPENYMSVEVNNLIIKTIREDVATRKKSPRQAMDEIADALQALASQ